MNLRNIMLMLLILGGVFTWGCFMGDAYAPHNWCSGYITGYKKCEIDFWYEQRATLSRRLPTTISPVKEELK